MTRLLLVDDEPAITDFIQQVAHEQGFEVHTVNRSEDFMDSFRKLSPDAIILDLFMPGIDGIELLRWLAKEGCVARIAIISGHDQRMLESARRFGEASRLKVVDTLSKPIRLAALRETLTLLGQVF